MSTRRIGDFELHELLGEGAMGKVYRAHDVNLDRPVALKLLGERTFGDPSFTDRFKREARLAAQLNHPHIATIYTFGEDNGEAYIAMEFVEGETLEDMIKRQGPLDVLEVKKFGRQAAAALSVAHEAGIVHRDIKSANLMVTAGGDLKVMDFGVARRSGETQLTMAGSLVGTANIMAPELIQGAEATPACDLFSLGCVIYEALAGRVAFEGEDPMAVLYKVMHEEPLPLDKERSDVPGSMLKLIYGLMNKDPEKRFGPARAVEDALADKETSIPAGGTMALDPGGVGTMVLNADAGAGASILVSEDEGHTVESDDSGSRKRVWLLGGSVLAVVLAIVAYMVIGGGEELDPALAEPLTAQGEALIEAYGDDPDSVARARDLFEEATEANPEYVRAWNNLGELHRRQGNNEEAIKNLRKAADLDSTLYSVSLNLGALYYGMEDITNAEFYLKRARNVDASLPNAHLYLGLVYEAKGDSGRAAGSYRTAIEKSPRSTDGYNALGFLLIQRSMPDSAAGILEGAVTMLEDTAPPERLAPLYKNLGLARLELGDLDGAEAAFQEALRLLPRYPEPNVGLAQVIEARGDKAAAIEAWDNLTTHPDPATAAAAREALERLNAES